MCKRTLIVGPLHELVRWDKIRYAGWQVAHCDTKKQQN